MRSEILKWIIITMVLLLCLLIAIGVSLTIGELNISLFDLPEILKNGKGSIEYTIISSIRIPRIILGIAVGGALSLSGVILQGIYRNPLVEPYTMGISGGAALGVALTIVFGLHFLFGSFMLPLFGFAGALLTIVLVYFISIKQGRIRIQNMLLIGVMISFIASSAIDCDYLCKKCPRMFAPRGSMPLVYHDDVEMQNGGNGGERSGQIVP